jgi:hypothetical protein
MRRRIALAIAGTLAVVTASALGAPLGSGTSNDPVGDVHAPGLTKAQRAAVDLVSLRVDGDPTVGLFATATFAGNIETALGKGKLASAAVALVMQPKPGKGTSAGLVDLGSGKVGQLYRHTRTTDVGVFRHGKTVSFWVLGPGFENVQSIAVETVQNAKGVVAPRGKAVVRHLAGSPTGPTPPNMVPRTWDRFISLHPMDTHKNPADAAALTCPELDELLLSIDQDLDDPYFAANVSSSIVTSLYKFRDQVKALRDKCNQPTPTPTPTPAVGATFSWAFFSANEVAGSGQFTGPVEHFSGVRVVLPTNDTITNHLCPSQLPTAVISGNTITCDGGTITTGDPFTLNLQTSPVPITGMGGQLFGLSGTSVFGPFPITGP